ncbi:response regulator [Deferribacterales bacterium Es71-Z0220]|jgi:C4-dicarboxylate-specific signal transduction histidine kinase|uniref:response regulator n=1 Tax=Deferrivibrio essentukiensis TaxID=2880922 RepID=UPI001F61898A|nr:response regulator [Deferrivibrio essentukiensis]MBZ4672678.1 response regulator receiver sensor signal transduction histidine kinase [Deferribacteraceae bacterium]MCB4204436.1 response regulator [Deferrivibrio essentukiensis]
MYKVLYVEDNFENYKLVDFILSKKGFQVYNAIDGIDAIDKAKQLLPDIIIMDINLPNLMGYEAVTMIKSDESLKHIPIVALTAAYSDEYKELSMSAGCCEYFTKPIDPISFADNLKDIIENTTLVLNDDKSINQISREISKSLEEKARKILKLNKELAKYESKIEKILSNISEIIFLLDNNFKIKFYNNSALNNKNFVAQYDESKTFFDIFDIGTEDLSKIKETLEHKKSIANLQVILKNYNQFDLFLCNLTHMEDEIIATLRSISSENEIKDKIVHLEKLASIGQVTAGVIHEINNPLTALKTYFQILKLKYLNNIDGEDLIGITSKIEHGFDKIENLSKTLLSFARPSTEKKYPLNINGIIKDVIEFGEYELKRGQINIVLDLDENISYTMGIKSQLEQAILNILINAHQALKNTNNPEIKVKTYEEDNKIYLSISNNGPKIPDDLKEKIFEPFFSTKGDGEGTGLGLAIVRQIMNKHGAGVEVFSDDNCTEFLMKFDKVQK